jgi:hypothetical protein
MGNSYARKSLPRFTDRQALGNQRLRVSPFCLGWVRSAETVAAAFEAGINFLFVTTDLHHDAVPWPNLLSRRNTVCSMASNSRSGSQT